MAPYWIGGNWKCNGNKELIEAILKNLNKSTLTNENVEVVVFPTSLHLERVVDKIDKRFAVGVQNLSQPKPGAFTGELEVGMVKEVGVKWVLVGHSERRKHFHETDEVVAQKVKIALENDLKVVVCIGESLEEFNSKITFDVLTKQLESICGAVTNWDNVVIAYEPIWAIGTGNVASLEIVNETHQFIRSFLAETLDREANNIKIVYGGSVSVKNCQELASSPHVDGFLIGGASLLPDFVAIIDKFVSEKQA